MNADENSVDTGTKESTAADDAAALRADKARRAAQLSAQAPVTHGRVDQRRLTRTIVLGSIAVIVAVGWLAREFGIEANELIGFLATSLLLVGSLIALGLVGALVLRIIKRTRAARR
ncbi:MAG: hypothetical protein QF921_05395 [Pseudomonadales bacterium]|jgi:hypothetical protein|nr:hypothetical protein [Pseudomonadales bacterium]MDP6471945.1 hypothetical protein [Pseudomonadales bacterium]MDP6826785.1 hypothetical protein [Pseudomonadales bacterium]MDP6970937.1 hypothetical protein [Pseudomonadales bacterium]|tara:strand:- start:239 stop:589 length:351 start_codon:yes stop_codon:yes gene_type:complete